MKVQLQHNGKPYQIDLNRSLDISIAIRKSSNVNCYFLEDPTFAYFESPQFSGNLSAGGSVNCEKIALYPHASGTHTECALHVANVDFDMRHIQIPALQLCKLITVQPVISGDDKIINKEALGINDNTDQFEAIVVRTLPNESDKLHKNYSDTNPVYFDPEVLSLLKNLGFKHILTDLPSIDKESDEGRLSAHKNWFLIDGIAPKDRSITELIYIENNIQDGVYGLSMQVPSLQTDAVPSRILLYPCE